MSTPIVLPEGSVCIVFRRPCVSDGSPDTHLQLPLRCCVARLGRMAHGVADHGRVSAPQEVGHPISATYVHGYTTDTAMQPLITVA